MEVKPASGRLVSIQPVMDQTYSTAHRACTGLGVYVNGSSQKQPNV